MRAFILITAIFVAISWIIFLYRIIKRDSKSTAFGILAVSYVSYSLSSQMVGQPWGFSLIISFVFLVLSYFYWKRENNSVEKDINQKDTTDE
jgi:membrane protein implicated in regulation of membrane protease activity